jgi:hypothetical protein
MGMTKTPLGASEFLVEAPSRSIVIGAGAAGQPYSAFALGDSDHLRRYRAFLEGRRVELLPSPTALFGSDALAVRDPDGRLAVFGTRTRPPQPSLADAAVGGLPGQLEHVVVASARFPAMLGFYTEDAKRTRAAQQRAARTSLSCRERRSAPGRLRVFGWRNGRYVKSPRVRPRPAQKKDH